MLNYTHYSLFGWSMGGAVAILLAAKYPERIRKLIICSTHCYFTQSEIDLYRSKWQPALLSCIFSL